MLGSIYSALCQKIYVFHFKTHYFNVSSVLYLLLQISGTDLCCTVVGIQC